MGIPTPPSVKAMGIPTTSLQAMGIPTTSRIPTPPSLKAMGIPTPPSLKAMGTRTPPKAMGLTTLSLREQPQPVALPAARYHQALCIHRLVHDSLWDEFSLSVHVAGIVLAKTMNPDNVETQAMMDDDGVPEMPTDLPELENEVPAPSLEYNPQYWLILQLTPSLRSRGDSA